MAAARTIEELGFASLWSNDHFYPPFGAAEGPVLEGWMTLAGFAMVTDRIPLGCMVSGAGYRNPALLVKMATTLDHASRGRLILGLGAGWHVREHEAFGYALLEPRERVRRLAEASRIARGMLAGGAVTFHGRYFDVVDARNEPPAYRGRRMPLLIGGSGERFTLPVVARYADVWNGEGDAATLARKVAVLRECCAQVGRDPAEIELTVNLPAPCVRATRREAIDELASTFHHNGLDEEAARASAEASPCVGTVDQVTAALDEYARLGMSEVVLDTPHPLDGRTLLALAGPIREHVSRSE